MPIEFKIPHKMLGLSLHTALPGESLQVQATELLGPQAAADVNQRLEQLQATIFSKIPGLPPPSLIDHLVVVLHQDLSGVAYVNELQIRAMVRLNEAIEAGSPVLKGQIQDIASVDLGIDVPPDAGVIVVRSLDWRRALFFDFAPLHPGAGNRQFALEHVLARQALMLIGLFPDGAPSDEATHQTRLEAMEGGLAKLKGLLEERCESEADYQELLKAEPWMFGGAYVRIDRHTALDDKKIPDFTGVRCSDGFRDIFELKQPFLNWFRRDGSFAQAFNDAWNQAEAYLAFVRRQRMYLADQKGLQFENPSCLLVIGHELNEEELRKIREKEQMSTGVRVITYDQLCRQAEFLVGLMKSAGDKRPPSTA